MLSVVLAVLAAAANATASVLQRMGARRLRGDDAVGVRMLWKLVHQPPWVFGILAMLTGFLLQAGALATGPIALVQPLLVAELSFTLVLSGMVFRVRLHTREWAAVLGMSGGLALLLVGLAPTGGNTREASTLDWIIGSALTLVVVVALTVAGYRHRGDARAALFGVGTGVVFGYTAVLVAGMTAALASGWGGLLGAWQTYAIIVVGPAGFLLLQNALRAGRLVASQPGLTLSNPLVAIAWGLTVFGEQARPGGWIVADVAGAGLIVASTLLLARSPLLHDDDHQDAADSGPSRPEADHAVGR